MILAAAALVVESSLTLAQTPKAPGGFGVEVVVEDPGPGSSDVLTAILTPTAPPGVFVTPSLSASLSADVDGDGILDVIKVNGAENGTTWQSPTAPRMVIGTDPVLGTPIIFIPAFAPNIGASVIAYVDFRSGLPPTVGALFSAAFLDIPFQMIDDGAGRLYVAESFPGAILAVSEISYAGGATPALSTATVVSGLDAEFQDSMSLVGTSLQVAHTGGVDVFSTPGLALLGTVPMPSNAVGSPYVPFTNMLGGLPGFFDMMLFAGQPGGGPGNTFITWSSATGIPGPTGGVDPGGAGLRPAAGFHDAVFTPTGPGTGTVTALLDGFPLGTSVGAVFQVPVTPAGPAAPVVTAVPSPFGNPEAARNGLADPIGFQVSAPTVDFFGAVTAGSFGPVGSLSALVGLVGLINPSDSPRPLSMAFAGLPTTDFALTTSIGVASVNVLSVGAGPTITSTTAFPAPGGAASLGTVWPAGAPGGPLPVSFQQIAGLGVLAQVGAPFNTPAISLTAFDTAILPAIPIGPLVGVPAPQSTTPTVTASETSLNFDAPNVPGSFVTLHPTPGIPLPLPGVASIAKGATYAGPLAFYAGIGSFVTEFESY